MKIRKVDDKPMVIHTKEKAKIHAHEPKGAKIKGSNIYTVERGPKTAGAKVTDTDRKKSYRKSTIHQSEPKNKGLSRFKQNLKESNTSIKTKNTNLHIAGRTGALVAGAVTDQVEGGQEVSQAAYLAYEAMAYDIYMHNFFSKEPNSKLNDILIEAEKSVVQVGEAKTSNGEYPFFTSGATILKWDEPFVDGRNCFLNTGGNADVKFYVGKTAYSTDTWSISAKSEMSDYLYLMLFSIKPELDQKFFQGTGLKHLQKPLLKDRPIYVPEKMELEAFNRQVMPMLDIISENTRENQQLTSLRDWLLPMLMNGQATIND